MTASRDSGSFRDPSGSIFHSGNKIYRTVNPCAKDSFDSVRASGLIDELIKRDWLVNETKVRTELPGLDAASYSYLLEHPKLKTISYPYEWSFSQLKDAALLHLDIQLLALEHKVTLSDCSAYNIQFQGAKPIFIDHLSFQPYKDGEYWVAHGQFCQQFLNPLLLRAYCGVPHNAWYRGNQEGISTEEINRLIPQRKKWLSLNLLTHVALQAKLQNSGSPKAKAQKTAQKPLPRQAYSNMLQSLHSWIQKLKPYGKDQTVWGDYATNNSYDSDEAANKKAFIKKVVKASKAEVVWDFGCNTGDYSLAALEAGCDTAVGFDFDQDALDQGYQRAKAEQHNFTPLYFDAANPSPSQGWNQNERSGLTERKTADCVLALALIHHLAIAKNIPLKEVISWVTSFAPEGVIEFVPKADPMVQELLALREDIFPDYTEENFLSLVSENADIVSKETTSKSGRLLVHYKRK